MAGVNPNEESQPMNSTCVEIVVYKVKNADAAAAARRTVRPHIEAFPGFVSWQAVTSADDPLMFTDLVTWESLGHARDAGNKVMSDPACAPFMAQIDAVVSAGHYI
jgi:hypothetical protein